MAQIGAAPFIPVSEAAVTAAEKTKAVKDGIDKLSELMPIFMKALDELTALHPFIGGALIRYYMSLQSKRESSYRPGVQDGVHPGAKSSRQ
jgi:hypothetical protein